ncbi:3,4-dihydroxy-2-butanone-4-phosphate synthase, partial [Methyloceanibacter superfactus]|uniref:3,4-dihydroxy-2-butanone-4-phosphate synthase n=1 Tax=Methyloceanibacter superfactus TaxID=1774969 RepID=UPI003CC7A853
MRGDQLCTVPEAVDDLRRGRMIVLVDNPDRENEGDLVMLAEHATPEAINFMACQGRGLICLPLPANDCDRLGLELQPRRHTAPSTRASPSPSTQPTLRVPASARRPAPTPFAARRIPSPLRRIFHRPGHVFPLRAAKGAVVRAAYRGDRRSGPLGRCTRGGRICEIMNETARWHACRSCTSPPGAR